MSINESGKLMQDGMELDQEVRIQTYELKLADDAVRIAQLEAGVQQLLQENQRLHEALRRMLEREAEANVMADVPVDPYPMEEQHAHPEQAGAAGIPIR